MLKALSIMQPWAQMIVDGHKPVENRTWRTAHRGTLLIHAGMKVDWDGVRWINDNFPEIILPTFAVGINTGGIIGMAQVVDCITKGCGNLDRADGRRTAWVHDSPWFFGDFGLVMENPRPLPFLRYKGKLGLFPVDYPVDGK